MLAMASDTSRVVKGLQCYFHRPSVDANTDVAVVVVHQCSALGGSAFAAGDIVSALQGEGLFVVSFDLRGAGNSQGCCCMWPIPLLSGCPEVSDVVTICEYVHEEFGRDIWLVGVSQRLERSLKM